MSKPLPEPPSGALNRPPARPYPKKTIGWQGRRLYLAPSTKPPISRWDYTSAERVEATLALGRAEAERHGPTMEALLAE